MNRLAAILAFVFLLLPADAVRAAGPLRLHIIGASVSAGFCAAEPLGGPTSHQYALRHFLDSALQKEHSPVTSSAQTGLFLSVDYISAKEIEEAKAAQADVIVGIDFLFWFCYGRMEETERLPRLEAGLALLDTFSCPVVAGDIPDARAAAGGMLSSAQVPEVATLKAANDRIRKWAAGKKNVVLLPLASFMENAMADKPIQEGTVNIPAGKSRALIQEDKLHATRRGCAALSLVILDALVKKQILTADDVRWDIDAVRQAGIALADEELKAQRPKKAA